MSVEGERRRERETDNTFFLRIRRGAENYNAMMSPMYKFVGLEFRVPIHLHPRELALGGRANIAEYAVDYNIIYNSLRFLAARVRPETASRNHILCSSSNHSDLCA